MPRICVINSAHTRHDPTHEPYEMARRPPRQRADVAARHRQKQAGARLHHGGTTRVLQRLEGPRLWCSHRFWRMKGRRMGRLQSGGAQRAALVIPQGSGPPSRTGSGGGGGCAGGGGNGVSCRNVRAADASIVLCGASSSSATKEKNGASASARGIDAARRAFRVSAALRHHRRCILSAAPSGRARIAPAEGARSTLALAPAVPLLGRLTLRGKDVTQIRPDA